MSDSINMDGSNYRGLQMEILILKQRNKTLDDLCTEYSGKYKALMSKTKIIEMENKSLKQELKAKTEIVYKYDKLRVEHEILTELLTELQSEHDEISSEKKRLALSYNSSQSKINTQIKHIQRITDQHLQIESKYNETEMELNKLRSILNTKNITINNLRNELELESIKTKSNSNENGKSKKPNNSLRIKTMLMPMSIQLSRSETPTYTYDRVSVSIAPDLMNTTLAEELTQYPKYCKYSSFLSMQKPVTSIHEPSVTITVNDNMDDNGMTIYNII